MVFPSLPVNSDILAAALPVGAHSLTEYPSRSNISAISFVVKVLPVPGPPVRSMTRLAAAVSIAFRCSSVGLNSASICGAGDPAFQPQMRNPEPREECLP